MDTSKSDATAALLDLEAGGPASACADDERQRPPAPVAGGGAWTRRLVGAVRVACECVMLGSSAVMSSLDVREGPRRRLWLALVALAYAAIAALVWLLRRLPADGSREWTRLAAQVAATAIAGVLAYCTAFTAPLGVTLFIFMLGD